MKEALRQNHRPRVLFDIGEISLDNSSKFIPTSIDAVKKAGTEKLIQQIFR